MNPQTAARLELHRTDFSEVMGRPFANFYCPLLFKDEAVELCQGHIINQAFPDSDRTWLIQRADVDSFFGSVFEAGFTELQHRGEHDAIDYFSDNTLSRRTSRTISVQGKTIPHYLPTGPVPPNHSTVEAFSDDGRRVRLALKIAPEELAGYDPKDFKFNISGDLRLEAVGTLLKAAHLTLFSMLGYRWPLSMGGHLLGHDILGKFFLDNRSLARPAVLANARTHFRQYAPMVRPINPGALSLKGTITDSHLYLAMGAERRPWAFVVLIRTKSDLHAVLTPAGEDVEPAVRFLNFLKDPPPHIELRLAQYREDAWHVATTATSVAWPYVEML